MPLQGACCCQSAVCTLELGCWCSCRGAAAGCRCKVLLLECCLRFGAWSLQGTAARCCCQSAVCTGAGLLVQLQGCLQGVAARCCCQSAVCALELGCCRVPLQGAVCALEPGCWGTAGCCWRVLLELVLLRWQASPGAVLSRASFLFPSSFSGAEGLWWVGIPLSLDWPRFGCVSFCLCCGCGGAACAAASASASAAAAAGSDRR